MSTIERVSAPASSSTPALDVVFLHGLAGDPIKTWSLRSKGSFWPRWLAEDNPGAAVWCVGFDASASRWKGGGMGILDRAVNLLARLQVNGIGRRPLCFVGHSLGGLMAKQMLFQAELVATEYKELASQAKGVVFLGTPHDGASIARIAKAYRIFRPTELLGDLVNDSPGLRHLSAWYRTWAPRQGVQHLVFFEKHRTAGRLIVPESSADPGLPVAPVGIDANHTEICKPARREDLVYACVNSFVTKLVGQLPAGEQPKKIESATQRRPDDKAEHLETQKRVFQSSGWSATLRRIYPRFELLEYGGSVFPIWAKVAHPDDRQRLDAALGELLPGEDPRQDRYPSDDFDPDGEPMYREKLEHVDQTSSFNGATYALAQIEMNGGKFTVHAKHGTYFHSLATSEMLERELVDQLAADPDSEVSLDSLPRRKWLHRVAGGERVVLDGRHRAAAVSVAASLLIAEADGTYSAVLARRSDRVETHPQFSHVAPAGIFAPINAKRREEDTEFSVQNCILREYAEEMFGYKDLEQGDGLLARDVLALPPVRELCNAKDEGVVSLRYCGISVPLLTLRPEIYILILIRDPEWLNREIQRANETDHWFELNWEYECPGYRRREAAARLGTAPNRPKASTPVADGAARGRGPAPVHHSRP